MIIMKKFITNFLGFLKRNKKVQLCEDCGKEEGVWKIYILKKHWGSLPKKIGLECDDCLIENIDGVHTGGGVTADHIKKIIRRRNKTDLF